MIYETFIFKNQTYNDIYPADDGSHLRGIGAFIFPEQSGASFRGTGQTGAGSGKGKGRHRVTQWKIKI